MHVVILGAGVVGVTTAYYLAERGHRVTVVDRASEYASGASGGNGGQLSYSFTDALASPALLSKFPGMIAGTDPAFLIRPTINRQFVRWGWEFLRQCTKTKNRQNTLAVLELALRSGDLMTTLREKTSLEFSHRRAAKLVMLETSSAWEESKQVCQLKNRHGCDSQPIPIEQAVEIEPALTHMRNNYVGAVYSRSDELGDTLAFTTQLAEWLVQNHDVEFLMKTTVRNINTRNGRLASVETTGETLKPDAVVVCLGAWSYALLRKLGIMTPIYPMRGYSVTLPCIETSNSVSITDPRSKTVFSRIGDQVRIAGFADFVGYDTGRDDARCRELLRVAQKTAPAIADYSTGSINPWGGLRPMTPNSQPLVGPSTIEGVHLNTGHGMLGWTLACVTGHDVAAGV